MRTSWLWFRASSRLRVPKGRRWRVALREKFGAPGVVIAVIAVVAWLALTSALIASKGRLVSTEEFVVVSGLVGLVAGIAVGRWGAIYLPMTLLGPSLVYDVVRYAFAAEVERHDPRPPITLFLVIVFVLPVCLTVTGGVGLRKLSGAVRRDGKA